MKKQFRNILLYTFGHSISMLGSIIYSFAIGLYILNDTGSGMKFAITLLVSFVPAFVMTPFAGVLADRMDKKKIVVSMDFLNGILFVLFFLFINKFEMTVLSVYITAFLTNVITAFFGIAFEAAKPQLVEKSYLQRLNSISQIINAGTSILGPVLGGFVYAFIDIKTFILVNGVSFVFSAISEMFIDFNLSKNQIIDKSKIKFKEVISSLKEGFNYVIKQKKIMSPYMFFVGANILISLAVQVPLPYILNNHLNIGSKLYGIIFGALPVGMIVGALLVGVITSKIETQKLFVILGYGTGITTLLLGFPYFAAGITSSISGIAVYYILVLFAFGAIISLIDVPFSTLIQLEADEKYIGRVWGILIPMIKVVNPIGYILAGFLLERINPFIIPLVSGFIFILFIVMKSLKNLKVPKTEIKAEL